MIDNEKYLIKWRDLILKASKALKDSNFSEYDNIMSNVLQVSNLLRDNAELTYECKNFGTANYIIEDAMPFLFLKNKNIVKEIINTIKEDKNLLGQFLFFDTLKKYNQEFNVDNYVNEAFNLVKDKLVIKTIDESNAKLFNLIKKYSICPSEKISQDKMLFFEHCDKLFKTKKKLSTISAINESLNLIKNYTSKNFNNINRTDNLVEEIEKFEKKYSCTNDDEKKIIKALISKNYSINEKENIFSDIKNDCLVQINELKKISTSNEIDDLNLIENEIKTKEFNNDTLIEDLTKLLDIKDILIK